MKKKYLSVKAGMSYFEITLLILAMFSFCYVMGDIFGEIGSVDAAGFGDVCCEETKNGNTCQTTSPDFCNPDFEKAPTDCDGTGFCEIGCCISENTGLCNERTSRRDCEKMNGTFNSDSACNIQECKKGCCILGNQVKWTTEKNCKFDGNTENKKVITDWKFDENHDSEIKCIFSYEKDKEGACVFESNEEKKCVYTTLGECVSRTKSENNFAKDTLCSDPKLNTTCLAKNNTKCVDGSDDVYWFDSCGNKENIAEDCDLFKGTNCGKVNGKFKCKDVNCDIDGDGVNDRKNGESWCTYDGKIGNGKDPVGSRHIKHICYMGTERLAPCADFRNEICVQEDTTLEDGTIMAQAACRVNMWRNCLDYNSKSKSADQLKKKCTENPDCWIKHIAMGGSLTFDICLPQYPPGLELNIEEDFMNGLQNESGELDEGAFLEKYAEDVNPADAVCGIGNLKNLNGMDGHTCKVTYKCGIFGCICIDNCKCESKYFTSEYNELCVSLGDCGAYINYAGVYTNGGYGVKNAPKSDFSSYSSNAQPVAGQKAPPGTIEFFKTLDPSLLPEIPRDIGENLSAFQIELMDAAGSYGSELLLKILTEDNESSVLNDLGSIPTGSITYSSYTGAIASIESGISAQIDYKNKEVKDMSMLISMIVAAVTYLITQSLIMSMIGGLLGFLFGMGWIMYVYVDFTCLPWEQPDKGECNSCNKIDIPCTEYRCESLGKNCHLINKGTGNELCVEKPVNETLPVITPFEKAITEGYKYSGISDDGFEIVNSQSEGCIDPYTSIQIGIKIDPWAKCKWGNNSKDNYENMYEYFGTKGNYILPAHVTKLFFPNPDVFKDPIFKARFLAENNLTDIDENEIAKKLGSWEFFVKCKTASGKVNTKPYHIKTCIKPGPDLTAPRITNADPEKGSYLDYGTDSKDVTFFVNEPSDCKWSLNDKEYDKMENSMQCDINPLIFTQYGWKCKTGLSGLINNSNFYVRCQDVSTNKNKMSESYVYELQTSKSKLNIVDIVPRNGEKIISGVEPVSMKLKLKTSGGAKDGEATCKWEGNGYEDRFNYQNKNGSDIHEYELTTVGAGNYNIIFACQDVAGNTAENSTSFSVEIDKYGPKISRIYYDGGLKIYASEESKECRYSLERQFDYDNASEMYGYGREFSAPWYLDKYYVQCTDNYGNKGDRIRVNTIY